MSHNGPRRSAEEPLIATVVICAILFAALGALMTGGDHDAPAGEDTPHLEGMEWPPLEIDPAALAKARRDFHGDASGLLDAPEAKALLEIVRDGNDHQFETHPIPSMTREQLENGLAIAVSDAITLGSRDSYVALGQPLFDACERGLEKLQADLARGELTLEQATTDPDFERYATYRRNCGNMLGELHRRGLVDDRGQFEGERERELARILQRFRWAYTAHLYRPPLEQLPELEREILARWRVEDADAFSIEERQRYLNELLRYVPSYPEGVALAMLAYEAGDKRRAAEIVSRFLNQSPHDPNYNAMKAALDRELAGR